MELVWEDVRDCVAVSDAVCEGDWLRVPVTEGVLDCDGERVPVRETVPL